LRVFTSLVVNEAKTRRDDKTQSIGTILCVLLASSSKQQQQQQLQQQRQRPRHIRRRDGTEKVQPVPGRFRGLHCRCVQLVKNRQRRKRTLILVEMPDHMRRARETRARFIDMMMDNRQCVHALNLGLVGFSLPFPVAVVDTTIIL
jgi:hypothetical protein